MNGIDLDLLCEVMDWKQERGAIFTRDDRLVFASRWTFGARMSGQDPWFFIGRLMDHIPETMSISISTGPAGYRTWIVYRQYGITEDGPTGPSSMENALRELLAQYARERDLKTALTATPGSFL